MVGTNFVRRNFGGLRVSVPPEYYQWYLSDTTLTQVPLLEPAYLLGFNQSVAPYVVFYIKPKKGECAHPSPPIATKIKGPLFQNMVPLVPLLPLLPLVPLILFAGT